MRKSVLAIVLVALFVPAALAQMFTQADPTEYTVDLVSADTEYALTMTGEVMAFSFQCRQAYDIRYSFTTGKVATPTDPYTTLKSGNVESISAISQHNPIIYFASSTAGVSVEVQYETQP